MMRRRSRRSRATWAFADGNVLVQPQGVANGSFAWIIPPGRVEYLCDTDRVSSLVFMGCHLWLDFQWFKATSGTTGLPDVTFYVMKSQADAAGDPVEIDRNPWTQPETPASITSWESNSQDGTDSFLWCHHMKGIAPANSVVNVDHSGSVFNVICNQGNFIEAGSSDQASFVCRKHFVIGEWQPDVIIKARRRLMKTEGIMLFMRADATPGCSLELDERHRVLLRKGR